MIDHARGFFLTLKLANASLCISKRNGGTVEGAEGNFEDGVHLLECAALQTQNWLAFLWNKIAQVAMLTLVSGRKKNVKIRARIEMLPNTHPTPK